MEEGEGGGQQEIEIDDDFGQVHGEPSEDSDCVFCCEEFSPENYAEYRASEGRYVVVSSDIINIRRIIILILSWCSLAI